MNQRSLAVERLDDGLAAVPVDRVREFPVGGCDRIADESRQQGDIGRTGQRSIHRRRISQITDDQLEPRMLEQGSDRRPVIEDEPIEDAYVVAGTQEAPGEDVADVAGPADHADRSPVGADDAHTCTIADSCLPIPRSIGAEPGTFSRGCFMPCFAPPR